MPSPTNISLNACFTHTPIPADASEGPPGHGIATDIARALSSDGWQVSAPDNWRDAGWCLTCNRDQDELEIALALMDETRWMLQVAPSRVPGFLGRLFGSSNSATPTACKDLAESANAVLLSPQHSEVKWCWDGFPDESEDAAPMPMDPTG